MRKMEAMEAKVLNMLSSEEIAGLQPELKALLNSDPQRRVRRLVIPLPILSYIISALPVLSYITLVVAYWLMNLKSSTESIRGERTFIVLVAGLLISLVCDVLSIALIRKVFASIATSLTSIRMLVGISTLILLMLLIEGVPVLPLSVLAKAGGFLIRKPSLR